MNFEVLDAKDVAILAELDRNSRSSYSQIARSVKLSKQSVEYRINAFYNKKVLKSCMPVIDYPALGYYLYRVYLQFSGVAPVEVEKILQSIYVMPNVHRISLLDGMWDCVVTILAKEPYAVRETMDLIEASYGLQITGKMILLSTYAEVYTHKFLSQDFEMLKLPSGAKNNFELDELDKGILNELGKNARCSLIEMASKLNTSYKVIGYRIKRLEKSVIVAYRVDLNCVTLGLTRYRVFVELQNNTKQKQDELLQYLRKAEYVMSFTKTIGKFDLELICITRDTVEFHAFLTEFRSKFAGLLKECSICIISDHLSPQANNSV